MWSRAGPALRVRVPLPLGSHQQFLNRGGACSQSVSTVTPSPGETPSLGLKSAVLPSTGTETLAGTGRQPSNEDGLLLRVKGWSYPPLRFPGEVKANHFWK